MRIHRMVRVAVGVLVVVAVTVGARPAQASSTIALVEVLASWQGNDRVQFVELVITADGGNGVAGDDLLIDGPSGKPADRRTFTLSRDVSVGTRGARILLATNEAADLAGFPPPDFTIDDLLDPDGGRICYRPNGLLGDDSVIDCLAYGSFAGNNGRWGKPFRPTPDNRSLRRTDDTGTNRDDWDTSLTPQAQSNDGRSFTFTTLCGDGRINQGEECDGTLLNKTTCADLGFAQGKLKCRECHFDASGCTHCGDDTLDKGEQCDGTELNGKTCVSVGFTGGSLTCSAKCSLATDACDPTFFVPGGGPLGPECLGEWRITNGSQRPKGDGKASVRQACKDGDPECDLDTVAGQCTFRVGVCFNRDDERLRVGTTSCRRTPIGFWQVKTNIAAPGLDLLDSVHQLGASTIASGIVTFGPALPATEQCTANQALVVSRGTKLKLASRTIAEGGKPKDVDRLVLVCTP